MAKTFKFSRLSRGELRRRKAVLAQHLSFPANALRASLVTQHLTCGKRNCRCRRGAKHGPFHYLVQCMGVGNVRKFLLKTPGQRETARAGIAVYAGFEDRLEELSQINTELLRREALERSTETPTNRS